MPVVANYKLEAAFIFPPRLPSAISRLFCLEFLMWNNNEVYAAFSFIGFILCCIPMCWHLQAWNSATCVYLFWTGLACLNQFINSVVWKGNVINWAPVWCDISSRIIVAVSFAIPAAGLCINRRLYRMATMQSAYTDEKDKRRSVYVDLAIGLGIPVLGVILYYIPQGHRFNILEDLGCYPAVYLTPVALACSLIPPVIISLMSLIYSILAIRALLKRRKTFKEQLSRFPECTTARFYRLIAVAGLDALFSTPATSVVLYMNLKTTRLSPWISWADTHSDFSRVEQIPNVLWRIGGVAEGMSELSRWLVVFCAFLFFALFGFAPEAITVYRSVFFKISAQARRFASCLRWSPSRVTSSPKFLERTIEQLARSPNEKYSPSPV